MNAMTTLESILETANRISTDLKILPAALGGDGNKKGFYIRGDGMSPKLKPGALAIIDDTMTEFSTDGVYLIIGPLGDLDVKRLSEMQSDKGKRILVQNDNPLYGEGYAVEPGELTILGRVVEALSVM